MAKPPVNLQLAEAVAQAMMSLDRDVEQAMYREAARTSAAFAIERMIQARPIRPPAHGENGRLDLLHHALQLCTVEDGGYAEFGVYQGATLAFIADRIDTIVYGFDSFEGLPEDWFLDVAKGAYSLAGEAPEVRCSQRNYRMVAGDFADTVPQYVAAVPRPLGFLHIDCCLHSSTATVLEGLKDQIVAGTVAVFDEYLNYPGWEAHEHRALTEFCARHDRRVEYLAFTPAYHSVAVRFL